MEVETHLELSKRVGLIPETKLTQLLSICDEISRMLTGLRKALELKS